MVVVRSLLAFSLVAAFARGALADDDGPYVAPDFMAALPPLPATADASAAWKLDLAQALQVAIHQNLGVQLERESVQVARLGVDVVKGAFEPVVSATVDHVSSDTPLASTQAAVAGDQAGQIITNKEDDWRVSIAQKLETGTQLEVDFINGRALASGAIVEPLNYASIVQASIVQPLLRGFSTDLVVPRVDILRAKIASKRERAQLAVTAADVVERTEDAYWDVVLALFTYDLQIRSQKRAEEQLALTHRQISAGLMPPSDLISAESTLAQRKLQVVQAELQIDATSDALRGILNLPREQWSRPIVPIDLPTFIAQASSAEDALAVALKHRPELVQLDLDLQTALLSVRQAENQKLPQLDLGLTGQLFGDDTTYGSALAGIGRTNATGYSVVLNFSWTPLQRATTANVEIQRSNQRQASVRKDQEVQAVWFAVRDAVRNQASAARQVLAAAKFRTLSTENLEVEQRKFVAGTSSNFLVAQRQEELATAQLAELSAVLGHKKATAALLRAMGTLLDARHVVLQ
jgi:outer membrane protein